MSSTLNIILLFLILISLYLLVYKNKKTVIKKSASLKKDEIVQEYKLQLTRLIKEHQNNQEKLKIERINFIKNVNAELNKNIFFTSDEIKKIIYELTIV